MVGGRLPLNYFGAQYRFWRGSLRFKAVFQQIQTYDTSAVDWYSAGAVFIPGQRCLNGEAPNWAATATLYANSHYFQTALGQDFVDGPTTYPATGMQQAVGAILPLAVDVSIKDVPYVEVEVPFTSHHNVNVLPNGLSADQQNQNQDYMQTGWILFTARFNIPGLVGQVNNIQELEIYLNRVLFHGVLLTYCYRN